MSGGHSTCGRTAAIGGQAQRQHRPRHCLVTYNTITRDDVLGGLSQLPSRVGRPARNLPFPCDASSTTARTERHRAPVIARSAAGTNPGPSQHGSWSATAGDWDDTPQDGPSPHRHPHPHIPTPGSGSLSMDYVDPYGTYGASDEEEFDEGRPAADKRGSGGSSSGPLLGLAGAVVLELLVTGSLVITPLAAAALALLALPATKAMGAMQSARLEAEAVRRTEARVRAEMASRVPVTPPESAAWMGRLLGELWEPYVQPMVLGQNLGNWADKIRRMAPAGFELELVEMRMGRQAPQMSNFQVLADPSSGRITAVDCDMVMDSSSMRAVVAGSGPVGTFTAALTGISVRGRMRIVPVPSQRLLLLAFREAPQIEPRLTVKGPFLGQRDIPPTSLLRSIMTAALSDCLVEPRRAAISLDPEPLVGQAIDTTFFIYVESVQGIQLDGASGTSTAATGGSPSAKAPGAVGAGGAGAPSFPPPGHGSGDAGQRQQSDRRTDLRSPLPSRDGDPQSPYQSDSEGAASDFGGSGNGGGGGGSSAGSVMANAAVAAGEAVAEGAGAIASLVPGLTEAAVAAVEGGGRKRRKARTLQVVGINTDNKLHRATKPVPYSPDAASAVPVNQMLRLNVGHKDGIFKVVVRDLGRGGVSGPSTAAAAAAAAAAAPVAAAVTGGVGGVGVPGVGGALGLLGSVTLHLAAAQDGSTLFWAAREGGEPVAVRWRPSDGPWRITLPLESPAFGLPPPTTMGSSSSTSASSPGDPAATAATDAAAAGTNNGTAPGATAAGTAAGTPGSTSASTAAGGPAAAAVAAAGTNGRAPFKQSGSRADAGPLGAGIVSGFGANIAAGGSGAGGADDATAAAASASASPSAASHSAASGSTPSSGPAAGASTRGTGAGSPQNGTSAAGAAASGWLGASGSGVGGGVGGPSITLLLSTDPWVYKNATPPGSLYDSPRPRSLVLQVVEARDLDSTDWAGTCDPYVNVKYDGRTYRTRTLYNAHTPVWQQTFVLPYNRTPLRSTVPARNRVSLAVYDSGVSRDDRLGSALLDLDMASEHQLQDRWVPLQGVEKGWLRVRLAAVPDAPDSQATRRAVAALGSLTRGSGPLLHVVVMAARALSPRPAGQILGMRTPYCNIIYGGARHVTPVVNQSQNPRWDFSALFAITEDQQQPLQQTGQPQSKQSQKGSNGGWSTPGTDRPLAGPGGRRGDAVKDAAASGSSRQQQQQQQSGVSDSADPRVGNGPSASPADASNRPQRDTSQAGASSARNPQQLQEERSLTGDAAGTMGTDGSDHLRSGTTSSSLPPYPQVPGVSPQNPSVSMPSDPSFSSSSSATSGSGSSGIGTGGGSGPTGRRQAAAGSDILRLEVKDLDLLPPDDLLGFVELPVSELLPTRGSSWQGWLPLRRGDGAELLVRISRVDSLPLGQEPIPLPQVQHSSRSTGPGPHVVAGQGQGAGAGVPGGGPGSSGTGASTVMTQNGGEDDPVGGGVSVVERLLLENFTEQVKVAKDLRVRLGQDVIPKLQDWWSGTVERTTASLEPSGNKLNAWVKTGVSNWEAGLSALSGKQPAGSPPKPALLPGNAASKAAAAAAAAPATSPPPSPSPSAAGASRSSAAVPPGKGQASRDNGSGSGAAGTTSSASSAAASAAPQQPPQKVRAAREAPGAAAAAAAEGSDPSRPGGSWATGADSAEGGAAGGSGARSGGGVLPRPPDGPLSQFMARMWSQLLGPPAYQRQEEPQQGEQKEGGEVQTKEAGVQAAGQAQPEAGQRANGDGKGAGAE